MMGVPTAAGEEGGPSGEEVKTSQSDSAPSEGTTTTFLPDATRGGTTAVMDTDGSERRDDRKDFADQDSSVLDENANVDVKVERLQLNGLTEDDGELKTLKPAEKERNETAPSSHRHDVTADGDKMAARGPHDDDLLTPHDGEGVMEGEEEEEEEEPPEMTAEERKAMHEAVKAGDIDLLEDLLEKPNADITMVYFGENLLVTALRAEQQEMAEFLLDNGVDHNFAATLMHPGAANSSGKSGQKKAVEVYRYPCRQMAYDRGFLDLVEIIDVLNGRLFPGVKPRERVPRFRRPPPTPTRSSTPLSTSDSDSTSSSSSGDESDISGATTRSSLGAREGEEEFITGRERRSSGALSSTLRDRADGLLTVPTNKKKKKKGGAELDGGGEEPQSEKDSGVQEERKKTKKKKQRKKKKKGEEEVAEGGREEGETWPKPEEEVEEEEEYGGSSSRRSGGTGRGEGNLTDRSKATSKSSQGTREGEDEEGGGGGGEAGVHDEGYETMSPSPSHPPCARGQEQQVARFQPPSIPVKANKAFLVLRRSTDVHKQHCIPARYNEARPLQWRKVRSAGSYGAESPLWHNPPTARSPKLPPPTPAGTPTTTVCMLSPRSGAPARSDRSGGGSLVSTVELGTCTQPKILHPSYRLHSGKSSLTALSSASGRSAGTPSTSLPLSSSSSSSSPAPTNDRLYPLQLKVPSYMRMTTSCFVKRRLEPNFTSTYSSLDFVEPSPAAAPPRHGSPADPGITAGRAGVQGPPGSSALTARHADTGGSFPSVLDRTASPPSSRKKGSGGSSDFEPRRGEVVPNIRNNSSVLQTSKLTSAKVR